MSTHDILLTIQYITVSVLFVEIVIVFLRWKNSIHSYLFLAFLSSFINNIGYLYEMKANSEEAYLMALKLSYVGRVWVIFAFFVFTAKMCRIKIPRLLSLGLVLLHIGIYISVMTIGSNGLFYKEYEFIPDPVYPRFVRTNGTFHDLMLTINVILVAFAMSWIVKEYKRAKDETSRQRLLMLIMAFGIQVLSFVLHVSGAFEITRYYDLTMLGSLFGTIFMLIAILGFDLLGTREIARDFVVDRISEGIIAVDNDGRIQYYNEPVSSIYPEFDHFFKKKELVEQSDPSRVRTPYDIIAEIGDAVKSGETLSIKDRKYSPEENELIYRGVNYGKLYVIVDDTEHYHYMEELQKQKDIADRANEAKSKFLANMSHEIRTPINAMLGMDEMILRESGEKPIISYASDIMSAGRTLLSLINDILDLSKVEEGKMEIIPVQYDLFSLINDLVNMTRERAAKKGLKFNIRADEKMPHLLFGDEIRIRQCATNLLTNAVKYTEKGDVTLTLDYEKKDDKTIVLSVKVEDTGIGMKEEDMESLFSPYKRIEEERNRAIEGTGLGMSITRQLLDLMGSTLVVHSEYGKGSVFSFAVDQEVVKWEELGDYSGRFDDIRKDSYEYHELFHAPEARILVVDDTEMNLTVIENLLKKTLVKIDTALSGKDALGLVAKTRYDALFIDHMMPEMDGIETLKNIRISGMNTDVPAVALTANAISGAREMYLAAGFGDYLSKPVDGEKLEKMLYDMIPKEKLIDPESDTCVTNEDDFGPTGEEISEGSFENLKDIFEIDEQAGLSNCGNYEGYISVLSVFHQTAKAKADEIERYCKDGDIENYTVKVHALKSSARIIGASAISELAKNLEDAGKNSDTEFIKANTDKLLDMYRTLDAKLSWLDKPDDDLPDIDERSLKEAYQTITEIAGSMDYGLLEDLLKDLRMYSLPAADKEAIAKIEELLTGLDWDGIIKIAGERS